jgi:hypothetical protein
MKLAIGAVLGALIIGGGTAAYAFASTSDSGWKCDVATQQVECQRDGQPYLRIRNAKQPGAVQITVITRPKRAGGHFARSATDFLVAAHGGSASRDPVYTFTAR